jgi:hypothetical protein
MSPPILRARRYVAMRWQETATTRREFLGMAAGAAGAALASSEPQGDAAMNAPDASIRPGSPYHGLTPPYTLASNIVYFHDWRYVDPGGFRWAGPAGQGVPMWGRDPVPPMHLEYSNIPLGIELRAQPARKTEPVLTPENTNELFLFGGTCIHDGGRYRLWYECWPGEDIGSERMGVFNLLRYAESDNGVDWRFPSLGLVEYGGSRANNIVYGGPVTPQSGYHGGSVFRDPSAAPEERYKAFHLGHITQEQLAKYREQRPHDIDSFHLRGDRVPALFGGVSPDGLKWTPLPEPLLVQTSDTHNVCTYDVVTKKYVAYVRSWYFNRRTIGRTETDDFRRFPLPEELFWPNASVPPYDLWYANAKTMMPGTIDYHIMFPLRWSLPDDSFEFHLATSPDGIVWGFVPGGAVCKPGEPGAWDGGVTAPGLGMVELPDDRIGILYAGSPVPHKYPRRPPLGALAWAWWPKGRLVALQAPLEGSFSLYPLRFSGRTAHLNFRTKPAGYVQVEAVGPDGKVIDGRSFADCDALNGDHLDRVITWRGKSDLGHPADGAVTLRFRLRTADLFSVEFK